MTQQPISTSPSLDHHLKVDQLSQNLAHRSTRSGALMIVSFAVQLGIGIAGSAVLARLLKPADFGYLAMVATLIAFIIILREFLLNATVYQQDLSHEQASGLFWLNCIASLVVAAVVAAISPLLAWFFREPRLVAITLVMSVGILVNMLGGLHVGLLNRQMRFRAIAVIELGAVTSGVIVGVTAAWLGAGYWALVFQQVALWVWQSAAAWCLCPWRPAGRHASATLRDAGIRSMLRYGKNATTAKVFSYIGRNTDNVLVGHFIGAGVLGLYQNAYKWAMLPFWQVYIPMQSVAVSSFSRLQDNIPRYRAFARTTLLGFFGLALPATALLAVEADTVILFLFGKQWVDAIPMLQILAIGTYFSTFVLVMAWLYLPENRTGEQVRWSLISAPTTMLGVSIGLKWGVLGVASGFTIAQGLLLVPGVWHCLRRSPLTASDFFHAAGRASVASIGAAIIVWAMRRSAILVPPHPFLKLLVDSLVYGFCYITLSLLLPGGWESLRAVWAQLRRLRGGLEPT